MSGRKKTKQNPHVNAYAGFSKAKLRQAEIERGPLDLSEAFRSSTKSLPPSTKQGVDILSAKPARLTTRESSFVRNSLSQFFQDSMSPETAHAAFISHLMSYGIPTLPPELDQEILGVYMQSHVDAIISNLSRLHNARYPDDSRDRIRRSVEALDRNHRLGLLWAALKQQQIGDQSALDYARDLLRDGLDPQIPFSQLIRDSFHEALAKVEIRTAQQERPKTSSKPVSVGETKAEEKDRLIAGLYTVNSDPDTRVGLVRARLAQLFGSPLPRAIAAELNEARIGAYINTVSSNITDLRTSETPQVIYASIQKALGALAHLREKPRLFRAQSIQDIGISDEESLVRVIEINYTAGLAFIDDVPTRRLIKRAKRVSENLHRDPDPKAKRAELEEVLAVLGDKQYLAYPEGITNADEMRDFIESASAQAQEAIDIRERIKDARYRYGRLGEDPRGALINPDQALRDLRAAIASVFEGDITRLAENKYDWQPQRTADDVERELDARHTKSVNWAANVLMQIRGVERPPNYRWNTTKLDQAAEIIRAGFDPGDTLKEAERDISYGYLRHTGSTSTLITELKQEIPRNEALRFVLATIHFAQSGEAHQEMLAKTSTLVEAVGGTTALDGIIGRVRLEPDEWAFAQALLAAHQMTFTETTFPDVERDDVSVEPYSGVDPFAHPTL